MNHRIVPSIYGKIREGNYEKGDSMLELKNVKKDYPAGDTIVHALKGIDLKFRRSEFVSILGPSGCGKTTLLNIIGGLDQYTDGDLIINGRSTKDFKARDWDSYRNHSIGFVFQSYNLIPHQTVLQNVELALTLSGVSKSERRKRAKEALEQVGLAGQLGKRPSQMSGGQMQRVAIARALVNNPDIILADEPTGALDTETSVQVMDLLQEISKDRLIIMVTHNPELAEKYSSRIIRILDGEIKEDSNPLSKAQEQVERGEDKEELLKNEGKRQKKPSMAFHTSFGLSLRNLFTKKGRTILTSFAGSIGIIGIALILSISTGLNSYIDAVEEETLTAYPIILESTTMDISSILTVFMGDDEEEKSHDRDAIYQNESLYDIMNAMGSLETTENDLKAFKAYVQEKYDAEADKYNEKKNSKKNSTDEESSNVITKFFGEGKSDSLFTDFFHNIVKDNKKSDSDTPIHDALTGISYSYRLDLPIYTKNVDDDILHADLANMMREIMMSSMGLSTSAMGEMMAVSQASPMASMQSASMNMFQQLLPGLDGETVNNVLKKQYDLIYGEWPQEYDEIILVVDSNNEIDDLSLYALGLVPRSQVDAIADAAVNHTTVESPDKSWSYEEICSQDYRLILNADCYTYNSETGCYEDLRETKAGLQYLYDNAVSLKVTGIIRPNEDATSRMLNSSVCYTYKLTEYVINENQKSDAIKAQQDSEDTDIFTGQLFSEVTDEYTDAQKAKEVEKYLNDLSDEEKIQMFVQIKSTPTEKELDQMVDQAMTGMDRTTIEQTMIGTYAEQMAIDEDQIRAYLAGMSDEELFDMVREQMAEQMKAQYAEAAMEQLGSLTSEQLLYGFEEIKSGYTQEQKADIFESVIETSSATYDGNLKTLGLLDIEDPRTISLYASSFENKDLVEELIADYNKNLDQLEQIEYTDYVGLMMSSITTILNAITYILIAFVGISLVVSSIMIGVITLISVQERTKEIGILRAIGASKRDVSSLFNAETIIIGFSSGLLGVIVTVILCIPINKLIYTLTDIAGLKAYLPPVAGIVLVGISIFLTLLAGIIPSRSAAKKDPVVALRSE